MKKIVLVGLTALLPLLGLPRLAQAELGKARTFTGPVILNHFGGTSKSSHDAAGLKWGRGVYKLRIVGGNSFSDPRLNKYIGKSVKITGRILEHGPKIIFVTSIAKLRTASLKH